jgi:CRP/FNR family transcriptional regulator, cyclic AMP receptor protein
MGLVGKHCEAGSLFKYFPALEPDRLARLAKAMSLVRLKRGGAVLDNPRSRKNILLVLKGAIAVTWGQDDRPHMLVTLLAPGEMLGVASLLPEMAQGLRGYAFTNSMVATINSAKLLHILFGIDQGAFKSAMEMTAGWSFETLIRYIRMFQLSPRDRLVIVLIELGAKFGVRDSRGLILNLPMTQNDLANLLGASRQKVNADLGVLVRLGAVINLRRSIVLVPEKLAALIGDPGLVRRRAPGIDSATAPRMVSLL